jgi:uncharacterized protein (DUF849 family)
MIPTKKMTAHVPVTPEEIIDDVLKANELGITITHIHARDLESGEPTYFAEIYGRIIEGIRKYAPELILCISLSGRNFKEFEKRSSGLNLKGDLKPDMGSLTLSSLNFTGQASINSPEMIQGLAKKMKEEKILAELEAFDLGMINYMYYLIKKDLITPPFYINLLFGNIAGAQSDFSHIGTMINSLPDDTYWSLAGIGNIQLSMNSFAIASGGGVRVGIEDNIFYDKKGKILCNNIDLIKRIHRLADIHEREMMKPGELRKKLGLNPGNGSYGLQ